MNLTEARALLAATSPSDADVVRLARVLHDGKLILDGLEPRHKSRILKLAALASPSQHTGKAANESEAASAAREVVRLCQKHEAKLRDRVAADDPPPKKRRPPPRPEPRRPPAEDYEPVVTVHRSHSYNGAQGGPAPEVRPPIMASVQCSGMGQSTNLGSTTVASPIMTIIK